MKKIGFLIIVGSIIIILLSFSASAAPKAKLWKRWLPNNPESSLTIDHSQWDRFLKSNVTAGIDGINRVKYKQVSIADRAMLKDYINGLSEVQVSKLKRKEQMSYWINLYNALTVEVIMLHYPVKSIREIDISPGWFSDGPWDKKLIRIEGVEVTLNDIEHRILRPIWKDPRIHYAVNCASLGCPNLQMEAFTSHNTEELLNKAAREYINHPRGVRFQDTRLIVSSIYRWFESDFGDTDKEIIAHFRRYASPELAKKLDGVKKISGHEYDWLLNELK